MRLEPEPAGSGNRIDGYDAAGLRINGRMYEGTVLMTPSVLHAGLPVTSIASLDVGTIERVVALAPALLIIGTGARHCFPASSLLMPLLQRGIGVEVMTTPAACRCYAVLVGEGREVAVLMLPPGHEE